MDDTAESMAIACRFAGLARKNEPDDYEVVIHAAYYAMHHAARAALLRARGSSSTNHGHIIAGFAALAKQRHGEEALQYRRLLGAAYDLRVLSDYGRAGRDLTGDAAELQRQLGGFLDYREGIATAVAGRTDE